MRRQSKYSLLAKNDNKKEENQQVWIELDTIHNQDQIMPHNIDSSYIKFDEDLSEIQNDKVPLNSKQSGSKNIQSSKTKAIKHEQIPQKVNQNITRGNTQQIPSINPNTPQNSSQHKINISQSYNKSNMPQVQQPANFERNQIGRQSSYQNVSNRQANKNQTGQSISQINQNQYYAPQRQQMPRNSTFEAPGNRSNVPNANYANNLARQSQMISPQFQASNYYNSQMRQNTANNSQIRQSTINNSGIRQSTLRQTIPQMTVNCDKCTFTQSVPGNAQLYICCMCNQINESYPLYGVFTCGICRSNVIYPYGTSEFIKCTKCLTINRVQPEPLRRPDESVMMGQEEVLRQEQGFSKLQKGQMKRQPIPQISYPQIDEQKPFKVLSSAVKNEPLHATSLLQQKFEQKRYQQQAGNKFSDELIQIERKQDFFTQKDGEIPRQILELSLKLDQSLILKKEEEHQQRGEKGHRQEDDQYPNLF